MRADMTPEEVRAAGIYLNGGRRRGWKRRLSALLDTPEATISAWATRSAGNARPIPGVAALALKLLVAMLRQELFTSAQPSQAVDALTERILALTRERELFPSREQPFEIERIERIERKLPAMLGSTPQPAKWLGIKSGRTGSSRSQAESPATALARSDEPVTGEPLVFEIKPRRGPRSGRPGSSV
jgi:hypothetical protein